MKLKIKLIGLAILVLVILAVILLQNSYPLFSPDINVQTGLGQLQPAPGDGEAIPYENPNAEIIPCGSSKSEKVQGSLMETFSSHCGALSLNKELCSASCQLTLYYEKERELKKQCNPKVATKLEDIARNFKCQTCGSQCTKKDSYNCKIISDDSSWKVIKENGWWKCLTYIRATYEGEAKRECLGSCG